MFKRFLKFLRGEEEEGLDESLPHDGSYLDHLLSLVQPGVVTSLERCPENDPVLLVVTGVLHNTMLNVFHPSISEPLVDHQSPGMTPPPAPMFGHADSVSDDESEADVVDVEDIASETSDVEFDSEAEASDATEESDSPPTMEMSLEEASHQVADTETASTSFVDGKKRITEKFDIDDIKKATEGADPTGEIRVDDNLTDITDEIERSQIDVRPRVDSPETLRAGRRFFEVLASNDTLPPDAQLSIAELMIVRDHLMSRDESQGKKLLTLVERKFNDAYFGQARLLLTLFPADDLTTLNNDRNIFYEEMILKLGIKRRHRMADDALASFETMIKQIDDSELQPLFNWFRTESGVKLHVKRRDPTQVEVWEELSKLCTRPNVDSYIADYLPTLRWREVHDEENVYDAIYATITPTQVQDYVVTMIGTCYFVLRAVGDTGLEPFLDTFFDWTEQEFGVNGTSIMPALHRRALSENAPMKSIVEDLYHTHFGPVVEERIEAWSTADVEKSLKGFFTSISGSELGEIAPGDYNLTAFVFDQLLGVKYATPDFPFKVHRLT